MTGVHEMNRLPRLMVVALLAGVAACSTGHGGSSAARQAPAATLSERAPSVSPAPSAAPSPSPAASASAFPSPTPSAAPSLSPSPAPSPAPPAAIKAAPKPPPPPAPVRVHGSLAGKVVVLDPGHNGRNNEIPSSHTVYAGNGLRKLCNTTGTSTNDGYPEHAFAWDVALRARALLQAEGATVVMTRSSDDGVGPCIDERAKIGNDARADAVVAIHADGHTGGHGFFVMRPPVGNPAINPGASAQSHALSIAVHDEVHRVSGLPFSTYIKGGYLQTTTTGGINLSTRPDVTIECLNMRDAGDAAKAKSPAWRQKIAEGIAAGITAYLTG